MKRFVAALALAVAACGEQQSAAEAARADSSAAGYAVGPRPGRSHVTHEASAAAPTPHSPDDTTLVASARSTPSVAHPPASLPATGPIAKPSLATASKPAAAKGGSATAATGSAAATASATDRRDSVPNAPVAGNDVHGTDSAAAAGPVRVNEFLTYDQRSRTVSLQLVAGYNGLNGSLNYNGAMKGNHGIYVPLGWRVHVAVTNHDSDLQHSAIVLEKVLPPPIEPTVPAFDGAALPQLDEGLAEDDIGTLDFVASRAGQYMIACGVPGHAQAGMWFQLAVLKGIAVPVYR